MADLYPPDTLFHRAEATCILARGPCPLMHNGTSPRSNSLSVDAADVERAARHLSGVPCLLLAAARDAHVQGHWSCWSQAGVGPGAQWRALAAAACGADPAAASDAASLGALDDLAVACAAEVELDLYPAFLASPASSLYASMQNFAWTRPAPTRDAFVWLQVR
jgi:hypothetical protein